MPTKRKSKATRSKPRQSGDAKIAASNKLFNSMTPAQRRVAIAKDVLKRIGVEYVPTSGTYIDARNIINTDLIDEENFADQQLQHLMKGGKKPMKCEVCARGALFLSSVFKFDNLKMGEIGCHSPYVAEGVLQGHLGLGAWSMISQEEKFFTARQIEMIEFAFESNVDFIDKYPDDTDRLIAIMKNIIAHKGRFVMSKRTIVSLEW